jgi:hypothetical protein
MWMASYMPRVLRPLQLQHITPHHKIAALAVVSGAGAIASGLATPLAGALSDRTTHRYAPPGALSPSGYSAWSRRRVLRPTRAI